MDDFQETLHDAYQLVLDQDVERKRTGRILLVDDKAKDEMASVIRSLQRLGYELEVSLNAAGAFGKLKTTYFDVIITDYHMPHVDGMNFFRKIRSTYPELLVIMMTGAGDSALAASFLKERGTDYLTKPVSALDLDQAITEAMKRNPDLELSVLEKLLDAAKKRFHTSAQNCREVFGGADSIPPSGSKHRSKILPQAKSMSQDFTTMANMIDLHQEKNDIRVHFIEMPNEKNLDVVREQLKQRNYQLSDSTLYNPPSVSEINALVWYLKNPWDEGREKVFWKSLRQQHSDLPVIMVAAKEVDSEKLAVAFMKQGGSDYLSEPISPQELYHKILRVLKIRVQRQTSSAHAILSNTKETIQSSWRFCMEIQKELAEIDKGYGVQKKRIEASILRIRSELKEIKELIDGYEKGDGAEP
ncbi:MAG: response regulator [Magnetococcales bacterium]|nr:response regulator [Magnetococcales bacterium]